MAVSNDTRCPIVLTATFQPHSGQIGKHGSPEQRIQEYEKVLRWLLGQSSGIHEVVFCENSGADLTIFESLQNEYKRRGMVLELVGGKVPDKIAIPGKGWGEGWLIRHALENSKVLAHASAFYKLTGRYKVTNLRAAIDCIERSEGMQFVVSDSSETPRGPHVSTRFFWTTKTFYVTLKDVYEGVDDHAGVYLEHVFGRALVSASANHAIGVLPFPLVFDGISGHSGQPLQTRSQRLLLSLRSLLESGRKLELLRDGARRLG